MLGKRVEDIGEEKLQFEWENEAPESADKYLKRRAEFHIPLNLQRQFAKGTLYAKITSRPGQGGRCDGIILEGAELDFYLRKLTKKK